MEGHSCDYYYLNKRALAGWCYFWYLLMLTRVMNSWLKKISLKQGTLLIHIVPYLSCMHTHSSSLEGSSQVPAWQWCQLAWVGCVLSSPIWALWCLGYWDFGWYFLPHADDRDLLYIWVEDAGFSVGG